MWEWTVLPRRTASVVFSANARWRHLSMLKWQRSLMVFKITALLGVKVNYRMTCFGVLRLQDSKVQLCLFSTLIYAVNSCGGWNMSHDTKGGSEEGYTTDSSPIYKCPSHSHSHCGQFIQPAMSLDCATVTPFCFLNSFNTLNSCFVIDVDRELFTWRNVNDNVRYIYIHTPWMCVKRCLVCSHVYRHASVLMKASCVDAEWQPERCESWGEQTSRARMTVWLRRSEASWKWGDLAIWAMWLYDGAISHVCRLEDKPRGSGGVTGEKERGACCAQWGVYAFLCVSGDARDTVHSRGIRRLMKKNRNVWLWSDWDGEERGYLTSWLGAEMRPGQICNSEQPRWVWGDMFPPTAAGCCDGGSICHLQILEGDNAKRRFGNNPRIQSCMSLLSRPGETQTPRSKEREQRVTEMKHYECLEKPWGPHLLFQQNRSEKRTRRWLQLKQKALFRHFWQVWICLCCLFRADR